MPRIDGCVFHGALVLLFMLAFAPYGAGADVSAGDLAALAPRADPKVIALALTAARCAAERGERRAARLAVIDYSKASTEKRLWVFDLEKGRLLYEELVAHGRNSGDNFARVFSNEPRTKMSSLGLLRGGATYQGGHGYTLRLHGLEPGINDRAAERAIVLHGAPYVSTASIKALGRLGRSWGCPVVRTDAAHGVIDALKEGGLIFIYYPDRNWLDRSEYLRCPRG